MGNRIATSSLIGITLAAMFAALVFLSPSSASASRGESRSSFAESLRGHIFERLNERLCDRQRALEGRSPIQLRLAKDCEQAPPPPSVSVEISADPQSINDGEEATLTWSSENADSCEASGGWSGEQNTSGEETVSPSETTTYTIACEGDGGSDSDSVTVTVNEVEPDAPTVEITADPATITEGESSTLEWNSENADTCTASDGWSDDKPVDGSETVSPVITTTYTIECEGEGGTESDSVTVTVNAAEEETGTLIVRKVVIRDDGSETATTTFSFEVNDEDPIFFDEDGEVSLVRPVGSYIIVEDAVEGFTIGYNNCDVELAADETETCTITNNDIADEPDAPSVDITVSRATVIEGSEGEATTTLMWDSTNADSCVASNAWSGDKTADGEETVTPTADSTYAIECVGPGGTTTDSVNVAFVPMDEEEGTLVISEVLYDTGPSQGVEAGNEWIEIFNGTDGVVNLAGYFIEDNTDTFILPEGTTLASGAFLLLTGSSTTFDLWTLPVNASWLLLEGFGGGTGQLANGGDVVELFDTASTSIDAVSWGTNTDAFAGEDLAVDANSGESIGRIDVFVDTGTATDWQIQVPDPGQ